MRAVRRGDAVVDAVEVDRAAAAARGDARRRAQQGGRGGVATSRPRSCCPTSPRTSRTRSACGPGGGGRRAAADRRVAVRDDLRSRESAVVGADVVDQAVEGLAPDVVAADGQRPGADRDATRARGGGDQRAVDVEPLGGAVVRRREMAPGVEGQPGGPADAVAVREGDRLAADARAGVGRRRGVQDVGLPVGAELLEEDRPPAGARARAHPRLERVRAGEVQRRGVRDRRDRRRRRGSSRRCPCGRPRRRRRRRAWRCCRARRRRRRLCRSTRRSRARARGRASTRGRSAVRFSAEAGTVTSCVRAPPSLQRSKT